MNVSRLPPKKRKTNESHSDFSAGSDASEAANACLVGTCSALEVIHHIARDRSVDPSSVSVQDFIAFMQPPAAASPTPETDTTTAAALAEAGRAANGGACLGTECSGGAAEGDSIVTEDAAVVGEVEQQGDEGADDAMDVTGDDEEDTCPHRLQPDRSCQQPDRLTLENPKRCSSHRSSRGGRGSGRNQATSGAAQTSGAVTLKDEATDKFREELKDFRKTFAHDSVVEISINHEGSGQSVVRTAEQRFTFTTFGAGLPKCAIHCKARELFSNADLIAAEERWPIGLTRPERQEGVRLEMLPGSISIVSVHKETAWKALSPEEQARRTRAEEDPPSFEVEYVLKAMHSRDYLRVHDPPQALLTPYKKAYLDATSRDPPTRPVYWKLSKGSNNAQMGKDNAKVAYYAAVMAEREEGGCEADVTVFKHRATLYIGMTELGLRCWKRMLEKVRRFLQRPCSAPMSSHRVLSCRVPTSSHPLF